MRIYIKDEARLRGAQSFGGALDVTPSMGVQSAYFGLSALARFSTHYASPDGPVITCHTVTTIDVHNGL